MEEKQKRVPSPAPVPPGAHEMQSSSTAGADREEGTEEASDPPNSGADLWGLCAARE